VRLRDPLVPTLLAADAESVIGEAVREFRNRRGHGEAWQTSRHSVHPVANLAVHCTDCKVCAWEGGMANKIGVVMVPTRYEALIEAVGQEHVGQVLLESPPDLAAIKEALVEVTSSAQSKLLFLLGGTGVGKTTLAASSQLYLANFVSRVVVPPPDYELPLSDLPGWLHKTVLPADREKGIVVVNLDGRELPARDAPAHQAAMVNLNAYLRRTKNLLAVWPVINRAFAEDLIRLLEEVGGKSALVQKPICEVVGIPKNRYFDALQLLLSTTGTRLDDAAVTRAEAEALVDNSPTIGEYMTSIHGLVVARYDIGELGTQLPRVSIVVSSNGDSADACRMLRRGNKYLADPERLLQFSRANVADDWRKYGARNARHSLPFIASLFEVRLLHLTGSMVVNACAFSKDQRFQDIVRAHYPSPVKTNAANTIRTSSLMRSLTDQEDVGPAGGAASKEVSNAYLAVQELSKEAHGTINRAIVAVLTDQLQVELPKLQFEFQPHAHEALQVDCWFERRDRPETLEFTHRKVDELSPASISSYVLGKIRDYARDYGLL
jgi:hypothetical protein